MNILETLQESFPDLQYSIVGNNYETLIIHTGGAKPSLVELQAAWDAGAADREAKQKKRDLKQDPEMPTLEEKVDALLKAVKDKDMSAIDEKLAKIEQLKVKHKVVETKELK